MEDEESTSKQLSRRAITAYQRKLAIPYAGGSNILPDGDPQASYLTIPVLTCNRSYPTVYTRSRLSQAGGARLLKE